MKANEIISEVKINSVSGAGAVPYNQDIDYFGLKVAVAPRTWLKMALELTVEPDTKEKIDKLAQYIANGGEIGPPWFFIKIPDDWMTGDLSEPARITGHEGRHRCEAILKAEGNDPIEVHLVPIGRRARDITPEWVKRLNTSIINERGQLINGPWFNA